MTRAGLIGLLLAVFWMASCKKDVRPANVLSEADYAAFLVDVYLAEARLNAQGLAQDSLPKLYYPFEQKLLEKRGLPDSVLLATQQYYLGRPDVLEKVYAIVIDTLTLREQRYGRPSLK